MAKRRRLPRGPTASDGLRQRIVSWLQESGNYNSVATVPGMQFAIQGSYPRPGAGPVPLGFHIVKPETERAIAVIANVGFSPQHKAALEARTPPERQAFFKSLAMDLNFHCGVVFQADKKTGEVIAIQLAEEVYFDRDFRREDLYQMLKTLFRAFAFIGQKLDSLPASAYLGT